ncbi:hypothetical protein [Halorussus litoreus]|uniref:hypothetical protein n=1 Tax=Halorussus litoreus TaxID=1710536 RepID=UPI000E22B020|nr:hypothetical protein [Halorussus litoreus]
MSLETDRERVADAASLDGTDGFFGFLAGLYAAVLVAPAVVTALALRVTTDGGTLYVSLLATVVAVVAAVGYLARSERLAVRLGGTRWVWLAPVVPFGYAGGFVLGAASDSVSGAVVGVSMLGMLAGAFAGLGLAVAARNRHAKAVLATAEEYARFTARGPERDRRLVTWSVALLMGAGAVGFLATLVVGRLESSQWLFNLAIAAGAGLMGATAERTVAVTDAGLLVGNPVSKRVRPWSAFESYAMTDDAVVVRRAGWSPWGLRDVRRDPEEVEDPDAVAAALGRVLPRR